VIGALTSVPAGDVDIFICVPDMVKAECIMVKIFEALQRNQQSIAKKRLMVTRSKNAVTFYRVSGERVPLPPVQARPIATHADCFKSALCAEAIPAVRGDPRCGRFSIELAFGL
jgi:hypothetical protein